MDFIADLEARGLIQDSTDRDALRARIASGPVGVYYGCDPSADSLQVGNLIGLLVLRRFADAGHRPVARAGGAARMAARAHRRPRAATDQMGATDLSLPPPAAPDPLAPDETALFCIGAHMAGLPLNGQLAALGARFLREGRTTPEYSLHVLDTRPGMVRGGTGSITGEVWAMPTAGTARLMDGLCLSFLAEAVAVAGTRDITSLGGWKAYLRTC